MRMREIYSGYIAALAEGDAEEDEVEKQRYADAEDDYPAVERTGGDAEEEESHAEFEQALVEEVKCYAKDTKLCWR